MLKDEKYYLKMLGYTTKVIRESKSMTQADLGFYCDLEKSAICKFESGKVNPTFKTLYKIAKALDVTVVELLLLH